MAFWSDTLLDPKRQFKFKVTFPYLNSGGSGNDSTFLAQSADRPVYTITDGTKVDYLDKSFHFPGKISWTPVKIKFVDATGPAAVNVSRRSYDYLARAGWVNPQSAGPNTSPGNMGTINKNSASTSIQSVRIDVLDSNGIPIDQWSLKNAFITTATLNPLDYSAEGILTAEYTFRYDWADFASL